MDPWGDGQPGDTGLGNYLVSRLTDGPTQKPLPTQSSIDIAAGCPMLEDMPTTLEVSAPDACQSQPGGHWSSPGGMLGGGEPLMSWQLNCWMEAPTVAFTVPSGDLFGTSQTVGLIADDSMTLYDCRGNPKYSIEERVYHAAGQASPQLCERYESCDGTVWLQYFVYDWADGNTVAKTPYLRLFQDVFEVQDKGGETIATVSRVGEWSPVGGECGEPRKWALEFAKMDSGPFAKPKDQWPIAEMVTMISVRDTNRRPSGLLAPSGCQFRSYFVELVTVVLLVVLLCGGSVLFLRKGLVPIREFMFRLEDDCCPRRMRIPSKYEEY